jgi:hypothetical protein
MFPGSLLLDAAQCPFPEGSMSESLANPVPCPPSRSYTCDTEEPSLRGVYMCICKFMQNRQVMGTRDKGYDYNFATPVIKRK